MSLYHWRKGNYFSVFIKISKFRNIPAYLKTCTEIPYLLINYWWFSTTVLKHSILTASKCTTVWHVPRFSNGGDAIQVWSVAANKYIINKHLSAADKGGWSQHYSRKMKVMGYKITQDIGIGWMSWSRLWNSKRHENMEWISLAHYSILWWL